MTTVHGTHFTRLYGVLRTNVTGTLVRVSLGAAFGPDTWAPPFATVEVLGEQKSRKIAYQAKKVGKEATFASFSREDVSVVATSRVAVAVRAAGWEVRVSRKAIYFALPKSNTGNYLNIDLRRMEAWADPAHGILGQSFGLNRNKTDGKLDDYGNLDEVTTSAQGEGAIEGVIGDYRITTPFNTTFKFSRFDAKRQSSGAVTDAAAVLAQSAAADADDEA